MKKFLFIILAFVSVSTLTYASFPVSNESVATEVVVSPEAPSTTSSDVDWTLFILCFFFGALGVHRFAMGDVANGILMLLTAGGCGVWALIDLIKIARGKMRL
jgi:hypothetical protein